MIRPGQGTGGKARFELVFVGRLTLSDCANMNGIIIIIVIIIMMIIMMMMMMMIIIIIIIIA